MSNITMLSFRGDRSVQGQDINIRLLLRNISDQGLHNCHSAHLCRYYFMVPVSNGSLAKTSLQGTVKEQRKRDRQKKRRDDNIKEWTGMDFAISTRASE